MVQAIKRLWKEESGQGLVEYGLIIGLVAVVVIGALTLMGTSIDGLFDEVNDNLDTPAATE
ncbi:MAG TPA: Flp family type IVb pilin [Bacilli bacterium]|nr:Flp family type IVb pilin [Bacilli bacterium]